MKKAIAFLPNLLTICNLLSGCAAVSVLFLQTDFRAAFGWVIAAAGFDFFDGFAARMLRVSSPTGKELDSLADMVSFGLTPAAVVFMLLNGRIGGWAGAAFLLTACAALRLAKFNTDDRQHDEFRGLPTPACALFFVSLPMLHCGWTEQPAAVLILTGLFAALLVCDLPMFSLKFKTFGFKNNALRYLFIAFSVLLLGWLGLAAPAAIVFAYIAVSTGRALCRKRDTND